jgi:uncharacterized DUF497 family protein
MVSQSWNFPRFKFALSNLLASRQRFPFVGRFITVGMSRNGRVLIVAHSDRGENIRIISAGNTTLRERKHYEEEN